MVYVGVDVAKGKHDCFILSSEGEVLADVFTIPNSIDGFQLLVQAEQVRACQMEEVAHHQVRGPGLLQLRQAVEHVKGVFSLFFDGVMDGDGEGLEPVAQLHREDLQPLHGLQYGRVLREADVDKVPVVLRRLGREDPAQDLNWSSSDTCYTALSPRRMLSSAWSIMGMPELIRSNAAMAHASLHYYRTRSKGLLSRPLLFSAGYAVTLDHISVSALGGVGVTGQQRQHIPPRLDRISLMSSGSMILMDVTL